MAEPPLPPGYLHVPERFNMAVAACDRWLTEGHGGRPAIRFEDRVLTYEDLARRANRWGNALRALGVGRGDTFVVRSHNQPDYCAAVLGGLKLGAVAIFAGSLLGPQELAHIVDNGDARVVLTGERELDAVLQVRREGAHVDHVVLFSGEAPGCLRADDLLAAAADRLDAAPTKAGEPAFMVYSSGTTGKSKGIVHAHSWLIALGDTNARYMMGLGPDDVSWFTGELSFMYCVGHGFFYPLYTGGSLVLVPRRVDPHVVLETVQRHRVSVLATVPTSYRMLLAQPGIEKGYDVRSLRLCVSAGEALAAETFDEWRRRLDVTIYDGIGVSEHQIFCSNVPWRPVKPGSMGRPYPGIHVSVLTEDGADVPAETVGHLAIREDTPGLFVDYRKAPDRWQASHRHGHYYTGDLARRDADGDYWYVARADDLVKSRGYLIAPKEVEDSVTGHPAVADVGVVGVPDDIAGKRVKAWVVLRPGFDADERLATEIRDWSRARIAPYKVPKEIEFVAALPKTSTGKVKRRDLTSGEGAVFVF